MDEFADCVKALPPVADDKAARLLLDPDEMKDLFEKAKITPQSRNSLLMEFIKLMYESNRTGNRARQAGRESARQRPHLAILGGATPEGYSTMWTGTSGGSGGLQSRFVLVTTNAPKMPINKKSSDSEFLVASLGRLQEQIKLPGQQIRLDAEAARMLEDWWTGSVRG